MTKVERYELKRQQMENEAVKKDKKKAQNDESYEADQIAMETAKLTSKNREKRTVKRRMTK